MVAVFYSIETDSGMVENINAQSSLKITQAAINAVGKGGLPSLKIHFHSTLR
jgi:hypothetical protein